MHVPVCIWTPEDRFGKPMGKTLSQGPFCIGNHGCCPNVLHRSGCHQIVQVAATMTTTAAIVRIGMKWQEHICVEPGRLPHNALRQATSIKYKTRAYSPLRDCVYCG